MLIAKSSFRYMKNMRLCLYMCNDDWNIDHRRWSKKMLPLEGPTLKKIIHSFMTEGWHGCHSKNVFLTQNNASCSLQCILGQRSWYQEQWRSDPYFGDHPWNSPHADCEATDRLKIKLKNIRDQMKDTDSFFFCKKIGFFILERYEFYHQKKSHPFVTRESVVNTC